MSASLKPLSIEEFLAWERAQPLRYEFDGVQPVAMTGGSFAHATMIARLITALSNRVKPPCVVAGSELKVVTQDRIRYPDASVVCTPPATADDIVEPTVVCEVLSPSTALTDRRVKAAEYATVPTIQAYVMIETEHPTVYVRRRSTVWEEEELSGQQSVLSLPEIGIVFPLDALYPPE